MSNERSGCCERCVNDTSACLLLTLFYCFMVNTFCLFVAIPAIIEVIFTPFYKLCEFCAWCIEKCKGRDDDNDQINNAPSETIVDEEDVPSINQEFRETRREYLLQNLIIKTVISSESDQSDEKATNQVRLCDVIKGRFKYGTKELEICPNRCTLALEESLSLDASSSLNESTINDGTSAYGDKENAITEEETQSQSISLETNEQQEIEDGPPQPTRFFGLSPRLAALVRMTPLVGEVDATQTRQRNTNDSNCTPESQRQDQSYGINSTESQNGTILPRILSNMRSLLSRVNRRSDNSENSSCPICLDGFQIGDEVCWSKNRQCIHIHHLDCMINWLMNHDECPLCRQKFV